MNDHRPTGKFRRFSSRTFRRVTVAPFQLALFGTVYFAAESLDTDQPVPELSVTAFAGSSR